MDDEARRQDRALLEHLSGGAGDAFWALWKRHEPHLQAICVSRMRFARDEAEDAISRSMLLARDKLPTYARDIVDLEAWLTRLVCNVCSDMMKELYRTRSRASEFDDESLERREATLPVPPSPEESVISAQIFTTVRRAIDGLPQRLRDVAYLRFVQGADYPAIAETLDITEANARKRVQQAREILRRELEMWRS